MDDQAFLCRKRHAIMDLDELIERLLAIRQQLGGSALVPEITQFRYVVDGTHARPTIFLTSPEKVVPPKLAAQIIE